MKKQKRLKATHFSRDWRMACINNLGESTNSIKFLSTKKLDWIAKAYQNKWPRGLVIQPGQKLFEVLWNAEVRKAVKEENTAGQGTLQWLPARLIKGHNSSWKLRPLSCLTHSWKTKQTSKQTKDHPYKGRENTQSDLKKWKESGPWNVVIEEQLYNNNKAC